MTSRCGGFRTKIVKSMAKGLVKATITDTEDLINNRSSFKIEDSNNILQNSLMFESEKGKITLSSYKGCLLEMSKDDVKSLISFLEDSIK